MSQRSSPDLHHGPPMDGSPLREPHPEKLARQLKHIQIGDPNALRLEIFPNFLILGPQRTGTTWLFHNLKKHPQIFLPRKKETYYLPTLGRPDHAHYRFDTLDAFLNGPMRDRPRRWLKKQYDSLRKLGEFYRPILHGEATATNALLPTDIIREVTVIQPGLKAILMLRNPVDRAWSHARKDLLRKTGRQIHEVPQKEFERFFRTAGQRALASYATQVRDWSNQLQPGHLFIGEFEMIGSAPEKLLTGIHQFFGVRGGRKYFNRHLRERINASDAHPANRKPEIPPAIRKHLSALLETELHQYERIRATLDPSAFHRAIHDLAIKPVATPAMPKTRRFDPA